MNLKEAASLVIDQYIEESNLNDIENVIIDGPHVKDRDHEIVFGKDKPVHRTATKDLPNLLKELGVFNSTGEARRAGRDGLVPSGYTELKASKKRRLYIWNPTS